ncbi:hypothetical protein QFC19_008948 [Naganishia cerealis]|uniref:Uncharacterized protein n=1 Tax=Naganishia cerealis TaxID=610337 RepID=A0ACC2UY06_9TREE|nr:hypothetical protein QFC19_008948 [Naganishia cerealis]
MATAQVLLHRFFYVSSMLSFSVNDTSMAALYLSTKLCETPIRLKELLNVYLAVIHRNRHLRGSHAFNVVVEDKSKQSQTSTMDIQKMLADFGYQPPPSHASIWWTMKDAICIAEMQILKRLGFNMQVCSG